MIVENLLFSISQQGNENPIAWQAGARFTHSCYEIKKFENETFIVVLDGHIYEGVYGSFEEAEEQCNLLHQSKTLEALRVYRELGYVFIKENLPIGSKIEIQIDKFEVLQTTYLHEE